MKTMLQRYVCLVFASVAFLFLGLPTQKAAAVTTTVVAYEDFSAYYELPSGWWGYNDYIDYGYDFANPYWVYPGNGDYNGSINMNYYEYYWCYPTLNSTTY